jgi:hypothetical protein
MRCERDMMRGFETCANCPRDCGECPVRTCSAGITCVFGCFAGGGGGVPRFDFACITECVASVCPDGQFFLNQVINCAIGAFAGGRCSDVACVMRECSSEIRACLTSGC